MAVVTHDELEDRLGKSFDATQDKIADKAIADATALVEAYLGYAIESIEITEVVNGNGTPYLMIKHKNITVVTSVTYVPDSSIEDSDTYRIAPCGCALLKIDSYTWVDGYGNYSVLYTGGWAADDIPQLLKAVIIDIAILRFESYDRPTGLSAIKVDGIAYQYTQQASALKLTDVLTKGQMRILNKYRCRRIG
jgi:hypothetical protein